MTNKTKKMAYDKQIELLKSIIDACNKLNGLHCPPNGDLYCEGCPLEDENKQCYINTTLVRILHDKIADVCSAMYMDKYSSTFDKLNDMLKDSELPTGTLQVKFGQRKFTNVDGELVEVNE